MSKEIDFDRIFAPRTKLIKSSAIRNLLKQTEQSQSKEFASEFISFGGGLPAPESFPAIINDLAIEVFKKYPGILQYGTTEGFPPLLDQIPTLVKRRGIEEKDASRENILITTGSQQALSLLGSCLISGEPNDNNVILVESPTYLGALQAWRMFKPKYVEVPTDKDGVIPEELEKIADTYPVSFFYTIPTFQNPSGKTIPLERRYEIAKIIQKNGILTVEDGPYDELRYRGKSVPSLKSMAPEHVIHLTTASKTLAPAFRLGVSVGPKELISKMALFKQGVDLCTSQYLQAIFAEYIAGGHLDRHIPELVVLYKPRLEAMLAALEKYFPKEYLTWSRPEGGMFVWAEPKEEYREKLEATLDMEEVLAEAFKHKVGAVSGRPFYAGNHGQASLRLNFSNAAPDKIDYGIKVIGDILSRKLT